VDLNVVMFAVLAVFGVLYVVRRKGRLKNDSE
jgi:hypothetical protein